MNAVSAWTTEAGGLHGVSEALCAPWPITFLVWGRMVSLHAGLTRECPVSRSGKVWKDRRVGILSWG